jgi:transposase InsO family protein
MIHVDIKKVGIIPDGGGWWAHGRDSEEGRRSRQMAARGGRKRLGYAYLHNAVDDHSRLAYTEVHYDEKAVTCAQHWFRAVKFYQAHGVMDIARCLTDNGVSYRSRAWAEALSITNTKHKRTQRHRPQTNGKVERYNQIMMAEWLYVRPYDSEASRVEYLADFLNYYNYERRHSSLGFRPPSSRVPIDTFRIRPQSEWLEMVDVKEFEMQPSLLDLFEEDDE